MAVIAHDHGHAITQTHADVTRDVVATLGPASRGYTLMLLGAVSLFLIGILTFLMLIKDGLGHAGYQPPIFWSVYITTFVFWIGIGHAGTLISAILLLFRQGWRTGVNRAAEAMTIFAVMAAGIFPLIHTGRPWLIRFQVSSSPIFPCGPPPNPAPRRSPPTSSSRTRRRTASATSSGCARRGSRCG
mgnify:CR=1 FL=1